MVSILVLASYLILLVWDGSILSRLPHSIQFKLKSFQPVHRQDIDCNLQMSTGIFAYQCIFFILVSKNISLTMYKHLARIYVFLFLYSDKKQKKKKKKENSSTWIELHWTEYSSTMMIDRITFSSLNKV